MNKGNSIYYSNEIHFQSLSLGHNHIHGRIYHPHVFGRKMIHKFAFKAKWNRIRNRKHDVMNNAINKENTWQFPYHNNVENHLKTWNYPIHTNILWGEI
jgi:hypothetical protein